MNDVLLNITGASIGRACIFVVKNQEANVNQHVCIIRPNGSLESLFLCSILISPLGQKQIDSYQGGGNREGLNFEQIRNFFIPLPSLPEQQKIAAILLTWDRAIENSEDLIEAKKKLKRGLMQVLFSGKKKFVLAGSVTWKETEFFNLAERRREKKSLAGQSSPVIELENIEPETGALLGTTYDSTVGAIKSVFKKGDVLFGKLRPYLRKYFLCGFEGICSTEFWVLIAKEGIENRFLYFLVQSEQFLKACNATFGSKMPRADWDYVSETPFLLSSAVEQKRIANCLGALDREIALLENKAGKFREQKKGLMQKLLTGSVRVKV